MKFTVITFLSLIVAFCLVSTPAIAHNDETLIVEQCEEYVEDLETDDYCPKPSCFGLCVAVMNVCKEKVDDVGEKEKIKETKNVKESVCEKLGIKMMERCEIECTD